MKQTGIPAGETVKLLYIAQGEGSLKNPAKEFLLVREKQPCTGREPQHQ